MREGEEFEFVIPADHGDLVTVDGYDGRFFMVIAYQCIRNCLPEEEYNEVVFEVLDAVTGEFLEADGEDVEFVTDAEHAVQYLRENPAPNIIGGVANMAEQEPRKPTARELSAQIAEERKILRKRREAEIDNLLEQRKWYADMLAKTNDQAYGDRVMAIDAELKSIVEK